MEESGENWPCDHSVLEVGGGGDDDDVKDLCFEDEFIGDDNDDGHSFADETVDPLTDRKERQRELSEKLLALSATIPSMKKIDNTSILDKASKYVKQLQERVRELEQEVDQSHIRSNKGTTSCEVNSENYRTGGRTNENFPEVRVRVLQKEVMVIIHCEKQKGIMLKILSHLENLHLSVANTSVLRFGKSTLDITIIAQMGDEYNMTVDELVKTLRVAILTQ